MKGERVKVREGKTTKILHKKDQYKQGSFRDMQVDRANGKDKEITAQTPAKGGKQENYTHRQTLPVSYATVTGSKTKEKR